MNFKKTVLDNGLRIVVAPQTDNPAVTVLVLVEVGSKYETKELNGISHFLEHMCFKGTEKRPTPLAISTELDRLGASYNAFTGHEYTGYYAKVDKNHFEKALDIVSDIYLHQIFDKDEIEREKGVIIEELNMYEDTPQRKIWDNFVNLLYGDQPAGWDIGGTKEAIKAITRDDFLAYRKDHYVASATTVVVSGAVDADKATKLIEDAFTGMSIGEKKDKLPVKEEQGEPALKLVDKKSEQTHFMLGVRGYDLFDPKKYPLMVLADVLGGGMSSRLWHKIRGQMGAAYYVSADADSLTDSGFSMVSAGVEHSKLVPAIEAALEEFRDIKKNGVSEDELAKAKDHMIGGMMLGLETSDSLAYYYGMQELLTKEPVNPDELAAKIRAVTVEDIKEVAEEVFQNEKLNLAIIGPSLDEGALREILKID